jgi:probable HAF family extracellular repeat protein
MGDTTFGRHTLAGLTSVVLAASVAANDTRPRYEVRIIEGPPCAPAPGAFPRGLNDRGGVVGMHIQCGIGGGVFDAFIWTPGSGLITLTRPPGFTDARAVDVSEFGTAVGRVENSEVLRAALWRDGAVITLDVPPGGTWSDALAVNRSGQVVGEWLNIERGVQHGFFWQAGSTIDLGPILDTPASSALDISDSGHLTGWMGNSPFVDARAFVLKRDVAVKLPPVPGGFTSQGRAVNNRGDVAGQGLREAPDGPSPVVRSFLWNGAHMVDLGTLPRTTNTHAIDLNDQRQIVGTCDDFAGPVAFLWHKGMMMDLGRLVIQPDGDFKLKTPYAIDEAGRIAGTAVHDGRNVGVLLTPVGAVPGQLDRAR